MPILLAINNNKCSSFKITVINYEYWIIMEAYESFFNGHELILK
jgi:hypothetical protein